MSKLLDWFDDRTGYREIVREALYESIPGGSRWRYVWGSTLVFTFSVQLITGMFLWMCYSPSANTAWESVYYIQHQMTGGDWLRGIHHFTAQAMVVLLALHLLQVVYDKAYKAPREVNFWLGLVLMLIVLGLSLTGYLLPWDQKGFWATKVATSIMGLAPGGDIQQKLVIGSSEYGHHTLTRFFALHAGVLPGLLVLFLALHIYVFRRHGIKFVDPKRGPDATFWPDQVLKDGVACLAVLATVLFLVRYMGAHLGAPADPSNPYSAARPEWYFLFLFQFLKLFPGELEVLGAIVIPGMVMGLLFLMPLVGRTKIGHRLNLALIAVLIGGAGVLTAAALVADRGNPMYRNAVWEADRFARLAQARAAWGIPPEGAAAMMRDDPKAQAFTVITRQCLSCHAYADATGYGFAPEVVTAPNLYGFATAGGHQQWIAGLLDKEQVAGPHYFGHTELKEGEMAGYVQGDFQDVPEEDRQAIVAALAAESGHAELQTDEALIEAGRGHIADNCTGCHDFRNPEPSAGYPNLTDYASRDWLIGMIADPNAPGFYAHATDAGTQKMPAFHVPRNPDDPESPEPRLSLETIGHIADWLRQGDAWFDTAAVPAGAEAPIVETVAEAP